MLVVKEATAADAVLIAKLSRQTFAETFAAQNTAANMQLFFDEQFTEAQLIAEVGEPAHRFFIAYYNEAPAGYLKLKLLSHELVPNSIEISRIYATMAMIGKGVGRALMQTAVEVAKQSAKDALWLGVWEHNSRAINFYEQWGFTPFAEHPFLLGTDLQRDFLLKKDV